VIFFLKGFLGLYATELFLFKRLEDWFGVLMLLNVTEKNVVGKFSVIFKNSKKLLLYPS